MPAAPAPGFVSAFPPAGLDRRFYAFALDRLVAWPLVAAGCYAAYRLFWRDDSVWGGVVVVAGTVLLVVLGFALALGLVGTSPGKAAMGLRVVDAEGGTPIGVGRALLRTVILAVAGMPTFGLGVAALAQTAVMDPERQRRGWHDRVSGSIVVDIRPADEVDVVPDEAPRQVVNLTAMRLAPATATAPSPVATPPRRTQPAPTAGPEPDGTTAAPPVAPSGPTPGWSAPAGPPPGWSAPPGAPQGPPGPPSGAPPGAAPPPVAPTAPAATERTVVRGTAVGTPRPQVAGWRVTFDTGESFRVAGLALVGRKPEGRPGEPVLHLVPLPSEDMSLSKTHAQFQVAADGALVVMDRGSTNGSTLVRSGVSRELPPGKPATLLAGDTVQFGDRSMTVVRES